MTHPTVVAYEVVESGTAAGAGAGATVVMSVDGNRRSFTTGLKLECKDAI